MTMRAWARFPSTNISIGFGSLVFLGFPSSRGGNVRAAWRERKAIPICTIDKRYDTETGARLPSGIWMGRVAGTDDNDNHPFYFNLKSPSLNTRFVTICTCFNR